MPSLPFGVIKFGPIRAARGLALADLECVQYDDGSGKRRLVTLLSKRWARIGDGLTFNAMVDGLDATIAFTQLARGYSASYCVKNITRRLIQNVNVMVGAPGFPDRRCIIEGGSGESCFSALGYSRKFLSYDNINEEMDHLAIAQCGAGKTLVNWLQFSSGPLYRCLVEGDWQSALCCHINKRSYLTESCVWRLANTSARRVREDKCKSRNPRSHAG